MLLICGPALCFLLFDSDLSWSSGETSETLTLEYPRICVHAISRDTSKFPSPCVYVLYSTSPPESESEDEQEDAEEPPPLEIRLVPQDAHHRMYRTQHNFQNFSWLSPVNV